MSGWAGALARESESRWGVDEEGRAEAIGRPCGGSTSSEARADLQQVVMLLGRAVEGAEGRAGDARV